MGLFPLRSRWRSTAASCLAQAARAACCGLVVVTVIACSSSETSEGTRPPAPTPAPQEPASPIAEDSGVPPAPGPAIDAGAETGPPGPPGSGGKGGLACLSRQFAFGRSICTANVGGLELKLLEPAASSAAGKGAMRLGVYVHGDGAAAHRSGSVFKPMVAWADAQHGIGISVLAPNGCSWWQTPAHDCAAGGTDPDVTGANAPLLVTVLEAVMKAYDIRLDGLRYYGASGGSIFLSSAWIPLQGGAYPGVFALMCGGVPGRAYAWDAADATLRGRSRLWFTYGDQDHLFNDIKRSIDHFTGKGFAVTEKVVPGAGHCEFDGHGEAVGIWAANP